MSYWEFPMADGGQHERSKFTQIYLTGSYLIVPLWCDERFSSHNDRDFWRNCKNNADCRQLAGNVRKVRQVYSKVMQGTSKE